MRLVPVLLASLTLALGAFAGTAYAYFSATGSGTGRAKVGAITAVTVLPATGSPTTSLFPGQPATLRLTLRNPNPVTLIVTGISQHGTVGITGTAACTEANAGVSVPTEISLGITLAPGTHSFTIPTGAQMATASASACQGASFHIPVTVTVKTS